MHVWKSTVTPTRVSRPLSGCWWYISSLWLSGFCRCNCWRLSISFILQKHCCGHQFFLRLWMWCEGINSTWGALGQVLDDLLPPEGKCCGAPGQHRHLVERHLGEGGTSKTKSFNFLKRHWPGWAPAHWRWRQRRWREYRSRVLPSSPLGGSQGWWWHEVVYMPMMVSRIVIINLKLRMKRSWRAAEKLAKAA